MGKEEKEQLITQGIGTNKAKKRAKRKANKEKEKMRLYIATLEKDRNWYKELSDQKDYIKSEEGQKVWDHQIIWEKHWKEGGGIIKYLLNDNTNPENVSDNIAQKIEIRSVENQFRGVGFLYKKDGYKFRGNMQKGRKCGYGQEVWPNGKVSWGLWFNNKRNAEFLVYENGEVFIETWRNDQLKDRKQISNF